MAFRPRTRRGGAPLLVGSGSGYAGTAQKQCHTAVAHGEEVAMIVMAGSFGSYGVPAHLEKTTGKVCAAARKADTIRYNGYSTSSWRSRRRSSFGRIARSRGRLLSASMRIVKKHYSVINAGVPSMNKPPSRGEREVYGIFQPSIRHHPEAAGPGRAILLYSSRPHSLARCQLSAPWHHLGVRH